jgi:thioredoxin reductase (NADPH)
MAEPFLSPSTESRRDQMFPVLTEEEIAHMRRFGSVRRFSDGERLFETGRASPGMFVVLAGSVRVTRQSGLGHHDPVVVHRRGQFSAELGQLAGKPAFVDSFAVGDVETLLIPPDRLRALLVAEADLGEKIMRALILRRVGLIESHSGGPVLIDSPDSPDAMRLQNFLTRNGYPHQFLDPEVDAEARAYLERVAPRPEDMPLVVCPDGSLLLNPTESQLAQCLGMLDEEAPRLVHDVAIVGAGPAGLSAAVYAASEGLSVVVIDARSFGGQAGASSRIENYLGFPTGISGMALAGRAFTQAAKFGARMLIPSEVTRLGCEAADRGEPFRLQLADGREISSRTVVIASGAHYRRPACTNLQMMEGRGVWYWASPLEARTCAEQEVVIVGGGNSAGQGAVFLSAHASRVWMLVRGPGLAASMSRYLIDRIAATENIVLRTRTEIVGMTGSRETGLESVHWRHRDSGAEETKSVRNVFLFLGADPATNWLADCGVQLDDKGFVQTGAAVRAGSPSRDGHALMPLETSVHGIFAIGDVRSGSVKRVGGAIGEGAAVVAQIHGFLAEHAEPALLAAS